MKMKDRIEELERENAFLKIILEYSKTETLCAERQIEKMHKQYHDVPTR